MKPDPELLIGVYHVCEDCKEGKWDGGQVSTNGTISEWVVSHSKHREIYSLPAKRFLSKFITDGYIDIDRQNLEPIEVPEERPMEIKGDRPTFGKPGFEQALEVQRMMRGGPNRPLLMREPDRIFDYFEGRFIHWMRKLDVGVPANLIKVELNESSRFQFEDGKYRILVSKEDLSVLTNPGINRLAAAYAILVATKQRHGAEDPSMFLTEELANRLVDQEEKETAEA